MKRSMLFSAIAITLLLIGLLAALAVNNVQKPFYVGVTFGGSTAAEAKQLIDRVKNYTNLFVIQSNSLQYNLTAMEEVCDYAVNSGLEIIAYFSTYETQKNATASFLNTTKTHWGSHFLGVYYGDEPGGKMLDSQVVYLGNVTKGVDQVSRVDYRNDTYYVGTTFTRSGAIIKSTDDFSHADVGYDVTTITTYSPNGTITYLEISLIANPKEFSQNVTTLIYQPDGTVQDENGTEVTNQGNITKFEPYQQLWDSRPLQTYDAAASAYVDTQQATTGWVHNQSDVNIFTSDYALYWWDYLSGYDVLLAQFGWNNTVAQEIGLVRGAANLQGKSWGAIITWKYTEDPYLASGEEIYDQMRMAYEYGAEYVVVFNYAENMTEPYGILQKDHFDALERFWNEVVQNPAVVHGGVKADSVLVLPGNCGWGMRRPDDTIWGLWRPDEKSQQVWAQLQSTLAKHDLRLDIVYDDPEYPVAGRYRQIYYWNQTG
jgi:hypothetical protein